MHGTYFFMVDTGDPGDSVEDRSQAAVGAFENYVDEYGDDNNWWTPICAVSASGELMPLPAEHAVSQPGDLEKIPQGERWNAVMDMAMRLVATDMEVFGAVHTYGVMPENAAFRKIQSLGWRDLLAVTVRTVPAQLADLFQVRDADAVRRYHRTAMAEQYDLLRSAVVGPFSIYYSTPYAHRCYDLRTNPSVEVEQNTAILLMDIHT